MERQGGLTQEEAFKRWFSPSVELPFLFYLAPLHLTAAQLLQCCFPLAEKKSLYFPQAHALLTAIRRLAEDRVEQVGIVAYTRISVY